jgi:hypothetical protein
MNVELKNLGTVNKNYVSVGEIELWFSYETCVAFRHSSTGFVCRKNDWSVTTGKFLNELCPDKEARISGDEFEEKLNVLMAGPAELINQLIK